MKKLVLILLVSISILVNKQDIASGVNYINNSGAKNHIIKIRDNALSSRVVEEIGKFSSTKPIQISNKLYSLSKENLDIEKLLLNKDIEYIEEDRIADFNLDSSKALTNIDDVNNLLITGQGYSVAYIDGGIDTDHPFLSNVIYEGCFSNEFSVSESSLCPNSQVEQVGAGSSEACSFTYSCGHGTAVTGIGSGTSIGLKGVAPSSDIIAVNVFHKVDDVAVCGVSNNPCLKSNTSDIIKALVHLKEEVVAGTFSNQLVSVNLSLGIVVNYTGGNCNTSSPSFFNAIQDLVDLGVVVVSSAGNNANISELTLPACFSNTVSVGGVNSLDQSYSTFNMTSDMDLFAPGTGIESSFNGGGYTNISGTSAASPFVAASIALLKEARPDMSTASLVQMLINNGVAVTDTRNNVTKPRIDLLATLESITSADLKIEKSEMYIAEDLINMLGSIDYQITVKNTGNTPTTTNLYVSDFLDVDTHLDMSSISSSIPNVDCSQSSLFELECIFDKKLLDQQEFTINYTAIIDTMKTSYQNSVIVNVFNDPNLSNNQAITNTIRPIQSPTPSPTPIPTYIWNPVNTPTPSPTPIPTYIWNPVNTPTPSPTPVPTYIWNPVSTPTPTPPPFTWI